MNYQIYKQSRKIVSYRETLVPLLTYKKFNESKTQTENIRQLYGLERTSLGHYILT